MPRTAQILSFRKIFQKGFLHDGYGKKPISIQAYNLTIRLTIQAWR